MDRLQIGAIALAIILILVAFMWNASGPSPQPEPAAPTAVAPAPAPAVPLPLEPAVPGSSGPVALSPQDGVSGEILTQRQIRVLENDALRIIVSNVGGRLESAQLSEYSDSIGDGAGPVELVTDPARGTLLLLLGEGPLAALQDQVHEIVRANSREVELRFARDGLVVTRSITIDDAGYGARLKVSLKNRSQAPIQPRFQLVWYGRERDSDAPDRFQRYSVVASADGDIERTAVQGIGSPGFFSGITGRGPPTGDALPAPVEWAGVDSQYFLAAAIAENPREATGYLGPLGPNLGWAEVSYPPFYVPPGTGVERTYRLYLGPKVRAGVQAVDPRLLPALNVGWAFVRPLVDLFAAMLAWIYLHVVSNYGVAIILLTIMLRLLTYPLTQRSMKSMKKFGVIAPQMKEVQEKHADDKTKMQEELMALYKRKGMNPLSAMGGGCIPMLIQMPFMIALYFALQSSIELRHAPFVFWIDDLSAPENLFDIAGIPIRLLPLMMGATMILQQRMTPSPSADPQQKQMMMMMSLMFIFLFYQFPSGLVLYWFVSNLLGILQQLIVNRPEPKAAS
ncbi:MAG: membrane protein insertase YidC [Myxococcota bacterium]